MAVHAHSDEDGDITIWTDCEPGHIFSGRVIGYGKTIDEARTDALGELRGDMDALEKLTADDVRRPS